MSALGQNLQISHVCCMSEVLPIASRTATGLGEIALQKLC